MAVISLLRDNEGDDYDKFLHQSDTSLFYASNKYRLLLRDVLRAEDHYMVARDDTGLIVAGLPCFSASGSSHGPVLNSLPFYGGNGAIIGTSDTATRLK